MASRKPQSEESKAIKRINQQMIELSKGVGKDNPNLAKYINALRLSGMDFYWKESKQVDDILVPVIRNTKSNQALINNAVTFLKQTKAKNKKQLREEISMKLRKRGISKPKQKTISMELEIETMKKEIYYSMDVRYSTSTEAPDTYYNTNYIKKPEDLETILWKQEYSKVNEGIKALEMAYRTGDISYQDLKDNFNNIKEYINELTLNSRWKKIESGRLLEDMRNILRGD